MFRRLEDHFELQVFCSKKYKDILQFKIFIKQGNQLRL